MAELKQIKNNYLLNQNSKHQLPPDLYQDIIIGNYCRTFFLLPLLLLETYF
jgi:hypothetical protein